MVLPTLPRGLEYRIIGTDLILLDQPANLIVDFIRNAIQKPAAEAASRIGASAVLQERPPPAEQPDRGRRWPVRR
jgi:hypothetical protein